MSRRKPGWVLLVGLLSAIIVACGAPAAQTGQDSSSAPVASVAAGAQASTAASVAAEASSAASEAAEISTAASAAGEGVAGGTLRVAQAREPDTLDPDKSASRYNEYITQQIFDELVTIDANGEFQPWLATSWEVSDDGLVWTFELREGVKFHDGTPFNAEAVKFNFDRVVDPATKSVTTISQLGPYKEAKIVDEYTVEVSFEEPFAPFLSALSGALFGMKSPAAAQQFGEDFLRNPVGTGPYMFVEWIPKERLVLKRNPDYNWAPPTMSHQGPGYLDEIIFTFPQEPTVRSALLESGDVDMITHVNFPDVERLEADEAFRVQSSIIQGSAAGMLINTAKPPTDDLNVRRAIALATDQNEISQLVSFGVEVPIKGVLVPDSWIYYSKDAEVAGVNLEQANALLEEAGWVDGDGDGIREKDGTPLQLTYICFPGAGCQQAEVIQAQQRKAGIDVQLLQLDNPANKEASTRGDHHLRPLAWNHNDPVVLNVMFHPDNVETGWSFSRWKEPALGSLLDEAATIFDQDERVAKYAEIQKYILDESLFVPTIATTYVLGINERVHDVRVDPSGYNMVLYDTWMSPN